MMEIEFTGGARIGREGLRGYGRCDSGVMVISAPKGNFFLGAGLDQMKK